MEFNILTYIGLLAAVLTTGALVPQTVKTWRSKSASDLSVYMYLMMTTGIACWLVYGWLRHDFPLILANGVGFCFAATILYFKIKQLLSDKKQP
jgi:MtN3 and saliva related transmembrane protein